MTRPQTLLSLIRGQISFLTLILLAFSTRGSTAVSVYRRAASSQNSTTTSSSLRRRAATSNGLTTSIPAATSNGLTKSIPRHLQSSNAEDLARIQQILNEELPKINFDLRGGVRDPFDITLRATVPLDCGSLGLSIDFNDLQGLSSIDLSTLMAVPDTEATKESCFSGTKWISKADVKVDFLKDLVVKQPKAFITGICGNQRYNQALSVSSLKAVGVSYTGTANLDGFVDGNSTWSNGSNTTGGIKGAQILNSLAITFLDMPVTVGLLPPELAGYLPTITTQLQGAFFKQLNDRVQPYLIAQLETKIPSTLWYETASFVQDAGNTVVSLFGPLQNLASGLLDPVRDGIESVLEGIFGSDDLGV